MFDICHGCRRCFNLCDSFPRLFDLVDATDEGEVEGVASSDFKQVVDACTLCDMCFMTKCPYVPPHAFDLDFPHLMLRYRAAELRNKKLPFITRQLTETDRNGKLAAPVAPVANWATSCKNKLTRPVMEKLAHIDREAALPKYHGKTFTARAKEKPEVNRLAPAFGRKAVIYATCFANYNSPEIGVAARKVLARNGVETEVVYPRCCGMPQLEYGDIARVAEGARKTAAELRSWIEQGYDIISLVPSCTLMMKFEWPLIEPDNEDIKALSQATFDCSEYLVDIQRKQGLAGGMKPLKGGVTVHIACHARAQNVGQKASGDAAPAAGDRDQGDRALLRPRRLLGSDEGELPGRPQGRQAGGEAGEAERVGLRRLGVPAGARAHHPGDGASGRRGTHRRGSGAASHPAAGARLRAVSLCAGPDRGPYER
ncbi:MAG: heterodisulfide reductase-related iron-sulfur binding cluster [Rhodospirillales bacterium]